jgi:hypothetical protein
MMKKFAANYVLSNSGKILKNSIVIAEENGTLVEIVDTKGCLDEIAQLVFLNGILFPNNAYFRKNSPEQADLPNDLVTAFAYSKVEVLHQITTPELIELLRQFQQEFPDIQISEILNAMFRVLNCCFFEEKQPGVFLASNVDLVGLKFKPETRLKQII